MLKIRNKTQNSLKRLNKNVQKKTLTNNLYKTVIILILPENRRQLFFDKKKKEKSKVKEIMNSQLEKNLKIVIVLILKNKKIMK